MAPIVTNGHFDAATAFTAITGITGTALTDLIEKVAHGLLDGQEIIFTTLTGGTGLTVGTHYFVVNKNADDFQVSLTRGGAVAGFSADITDAEAIRVGHGVPTGWTVTKAGSSEILAGKDEALSPCALPVNTYAEIKVDSTPAAANMVQAITLVPSTRYRISMESVWDHEDPAEVAPSHAPTVALRATGEAAYLTAAGAFQAGANAIPIPVAASKGSRLAITFVTPAVFTGYTLTIDKGTMDGTAGYLEIVRISRVRVELDPLNLPGERPENNDTVKAALPENS